MNSTLMCLLQVRIGKDDDPKLEKDFDHLSGLGFATCCRLINEFISTRASFQCLTLVLTTRGSSKSEDTVRRLERYLEVQSKALDAQLKHRISLQPEQLDLTSLLSVRTLSKRLLENLPHLDAIICNAGVGGFTGINWGSAIWTVLTDLPHAVTYPTYKIASSGVTLAPQTSPAGNENSGIGGSKTEPPLGQIFTSNVFGHYLLCHSLVPLLTTSPDRGRIVFTSSIEPLALHFNVVDIQALKSEKAYESSKYLTDILALTSTFPSTKPFVQRYLSTSIPPASQSINLFDNETSDSGTSTPSQRIALADNEYQPPGASFPRIYLSHPGICATSFIPLPFILYYFMELVFYIARWCGSPWHTVSAYKGAVASVWLALVEKEEIEDMEQVEGKSKWGSACDAMGHERVMRTMVEGWGLGGRMGEGELSKRNGTRRGTKEVAKEDRERFEELGRECWRQMEDLRMQWEERLYSE